MKTKIFLLMVAIVVSINAFAQMSKADKYRIIEVNKKINELSVKINNYDVQLIDAKDYSTEIKSLEIKHDSLISLTPNTSYGLELKNQAVKENRTKLSKLLKRRSYFNDCAPKTMERDSLKNELKYYQKIKDGILKSYLNGEADGPGMSNFETRREINKIKSKRENRLEETEKMYRDLDIKKMKSQPTYSDSIKGYKGIVQNLSVRSRIKFDIYRIDETGALSTQAAASFMTNPGDKKDSYLLPGKYLVIAYREGRKIDQNEMNVGAQVYNYLSGESVHWYALREGY